MTMMILTPSILKQSKEKQDGEKMDSEGNVRVREKKKKKDTGIHFK